MTSSKNGLVSMYGTQGFATITVVEGVPGGIADGFVEGTPIIHSQNEALRRAVGLLHARGVNGSIVVVEERIDPIQHRDVQRVARVPANRVPSYEALPFANVVVEP